MKHKILTILYILFVTSIIVASSFIVSNYKRKEELIQKQKDSTRNFIKIDIDNYVELLNGKELSFIYLASDDCKYCKKQTNELNELLATIKFTVFYLNLDKVNNLDYNTKLISSYEEFKENGIGTPTLLLVKEGKVVMYKRGLTSKMNILKLLSENDFLK